MNESNQKYLEPAAIGRRVLIVEDDDDSREMLVERKSVV